MVIMILFRFKDVYELTFAYLFSGHKTVCYKSHAGAVAGSGSVFPQLGNRTARHTGEVSLIHCIA